MTIQQLAEFFSLLTILEPDTITCQLAARLATAGTATDEETDISVLKEIRTHAAQITKELTSVSQTSLDRKKALIAKYLTPTSAAS